MLAEYARHCAERAKRGVPPLPLDAEQTTALCAAIETPPEDAEPGRLLDLLAERVAPGVDPAARVKADFLARVARGEVALPLLGRAEAVGLLGTMLGGWNVPHLIDLLDDAALADAAADALSATILVFDACDRVLEKAKGGHAAARRVVESWAEAEWFTRRAPLPERIEAVVFKVDGEINTDDFSPAPDAPTRPDIPLHALSMGATRFPGGVETLTRLRAEGRTVAFVGDVVGTGSSRKSAANSLIWHIGADIPHVPNKRRGGIVLGGVIAPIFFNTLEDSGALPIQCDVARLETGQTIVILPREGRILDADNDTELSRFDLMPPTLADEFRAGGRVPLLIGRALTDRVRKAIGHGASRVFTPPPTVRRKGVGFTLAQKIVGRACGVEGVHPGTSCTPVVTTVGSQDTTGPMTRDEMTELACLKFGADLVMQSFCHTAAYPTETDRRMHATLPGYMTERGGVALKPGDGVIHSWLNRMILPDTLGTGGDSHTRFPIGLSFPAGSGLVAFAAALGRMPLEMPKSVLVRFHGALRPGLTLRDAVNAIPWFAVRAGLLTVPPRNKTNVFNGRILEIETPASLTVEEAFELTDASAERSAAGATIALDVEAVVEFLRANVATLRALVDEGYVCAETLRRRIERMEAWLAAPELLRRDANAAYAAELDVDLDAVTEPLLACPNNPDDVRPLSEVAGTPIDDAFLGSCMTHAGHFRAAARRLDGVERLGARLWVAPPTRLDEARLRDEGVWDVFERIENCRTEIPGCSLCMGNQARLEAGSTCLSTSTRNFEGRLGDDTKVYLGNAELTALAARLGRLPSVEEYLNDPNLNI